MNKEEYIRRYGIAAYEKILQQNRDRNKAHPEEMKASADNWKACNPEKVKAHNQEQSRKEGKYYENHKLSHKEGLSGEKERVRGKAHRIWTPYKKIIDPEGLTQLHHQWLSNSAEYTGLALVEKGQHMHGYVDVIQILEGEITLLTEAEIREAN